MDFFVELGYFVSEVRDFVFNGFVVRLKSFEFAVGAVQFGVFEGQLLVKLVYLALEISFCVFERRDCLSGDFVLVFNFKTTFNSSLDFKAFLFKVSKLLN